MPLIIQKIKHFDRNALFQISQNNDKMVCFVIQKSLTLPFTFPENIGRKPPSRNRTCDPN